MAMSNYDYFNERISIGIVMQECDGTDMTKTEVVGRYCDLMGVSKSSGWPVINTLCAVQWLHEVDGRNGKNRIVKPSEYGKRMYSLIMEVM